MMARPSYKNDLMNLIKGLSQLGAAVVEIQNKQFNKTWANSSLRPAVQKNILYFQDSLTLQNFKEVNFQKKVSETCERLSVVKESIKAYASGTVDLRNENHEVTEFEKQIFEMVSSGKLEENPNKNFVQENNDLFINASDLQNAKNINTVNVDASSIEESGLETSKESILETSSTILDTQLDVIQEKLMELQDLEIKNDVKIFNEVETNIAKNEQYLSNVSEVQNFQISDDYKSTENYTYSSSSPPFSTFVPAVDGDDFKLSDNYKSKSNTIPIPKLLGRKPLAKNKAMSTLSSDAHARKVPDTRLSRLISFGSLAAGLGIGTLAEMTRKSLGISIKQPTGALSDSSSFLSDANARRIVDTLCKVRGAALKIGQMLSIQDNTLISPHIAQIFERVRQSADFMPAWQLERTLIQDFGPNWRKLVASFDDKPFAAASIGQVHQAIMHDSRAVAMKIQYPGVAMGIESDINNLISALGVGKVIPEGLFVDQAIEVAKKELRWECDYEREKACTIKFRELISPYPEYYVPDVIEELCTKQVFTTELIDGISVDKCVALDQETRNYICTLILRLCLMELFHFGFMQTDPNWSNFFYNTETQQLALVDFGACREYDKRFVDDYINVIHGAAANDREKVAEYSKRLGFLTGYEARIMVNAHVDAVMILGEAFQEDKPFDFGRQHTAQRIQQLVPVMLAHRMCPPPEESYSLHRKMSGVFLLCAKLDGVVNCKSFFDQVFSKYTMGGSWDDIRSKSLL